jgi:glycine cleavage system H protein
MALAYPDDLKYTDTHEYIRLDGDVATVGITAFAIDQLGDIVFLELPQLGTALTRGEELKAPVSGEVLECNTAMVDAPENLVEDPYGDGWLIKVKVSDPAEVEAAMTASDYRSQVEGG